MLYFIYIQGNLIQLKCQEKQIHQQSPFIELEQKENKIYHVNKTSTKYNSTIVSL